MQHVEASEQKDLDADVQSGWSEDHAIMSQRPAPTAAAPAEVSTISTLEAPAIRTYTPDAPVPTYTPDHVAPTHVPNEPSTDLANQYVR